MRKRETLMNTVRINIQSITGDFTFDLNKFVDVQRFYAILANKKQQIIFRATNMDLFDNLLRKN